MEVYLGASFRVEVAGVGKATFRGCRGLGATVEVVQVVEGGSTVPRILPGDVQWEPLVLERGWVQDRQLWDWFQSRDARFGSITLLDREGGTAGRWSFERGWPSRWMGPSFDADREEIALECLEIVHEGLTWEVP